MCFYIDSSLEEAANTGTGVSVAPTIQTEQSESQWKDFFTVLVKKVF